MMDEFVIYVCPSCGRTIKWPNPSTSTPNTICSCEYPEFVTQMVVCFPTKEVDDGDQTKDSSA